MKEERLKEIREKSDVDLTDTPDEKINYRLLQRWEVPAWIEASTKEVDEEAELIKEFGLGKRKRNEVHYMDEISDARYC
jgi:hypothetical protein